MRNDLNIYFGVNGRMEIRNVSCYIIIKDTVQGIQFITSPAGERKISLQSLVNAMNENLPLPVIDESGYTNPILQPSAFSNPDLLKEALQKYGLQIIIATRPQEMLVITDTN